jgi:hypothetical protein
MDKLELRDDASSPLTVEQVFQSAKLTTIETLSPPVTPPPPSSGGGRDGKGPDNSLHGGPFVRGFSPVSRYEAVNEGEFGKPSDRKRQKLMHSFSKADEYFEEASFSQGDVLFCAFEPAVHLYVVMSGEIGLYTPNMASLSSDAHNSNQEDAYRHYEVTKRHFKGSIFGEMGFFLREDRSFMARARTDCVVFRLSHQQLKRMETTEPSMATALHTVVARAMSQNQAM